MLNPSVQFSCSVVSDSFWPHGLQYGRPPCPSPTPKAYPNSCPSSRWCHPTISPSVVPFSSCLQSFPVSGSFPMNQYLNHYCLLITLRASPACQPGHLHSTQASSFAAPWGGPFEGIPHPRLEAEHGCVLVLLTIQENGTLKISISWEELVIFSIGEVYLFWCFCFTECLDHNTEARNVNILFNSCFFHVGRSHSIIYVHRVHFCPSPERQQR